MTRNAQAPDPPERANNASGEESGGENQATKAKPSNKPGQRGKGKPRSGKPLPPWKVILHNDEVNEMGYVVETITLLTPLDRPVAVRRMLEAHARGRSLLLSTHRERAELYRDQLKSRKLTVTLEAG